MTWAKVKKAQMINSEIKEQCLPRLYNDVKQMWICLKSKLND